MQTLVNHKTIQISVKSVEGMVVCMKCKGAKTLPKMDYYNSAAILYGGLLSAWHIEYCPSCHGKGFWKDTE